MELGTIDETETMQRWQLLVVPRGGRVEDPMNVLRQNDNRKKESPN